MIYLKRILNLLCLSGFEHAKDHWKSQRETAVILVLLSGWFIYQILFNLQYLDYDGVLFWASDPLNALILCLLSLYLIYHAELGLQVILQDYVSTLSLRTMSFYVIRAFRIAVVLITFYSIFSITVGTN